MSPDEISAYDVTAAPFFDSTSQEKLSLLEALRPFKTTRSILLRSISPLTPWSDDESKQRGKRKNLSKGKQQGKQRSGAGSKENGRRKKEARDNAKGSNRKSEILSPAVSAAAKVGSFLHHADIGQYMREYRELRKRLAIGHRNCTCHGAYGLEEIMKTYESLGLPKQAFRSQTSCKTDFLLPNTPKNYNGSTEEKASTEETEPAEEEEEEGPDDRELASPDARKRRNNLNLTPVRKHIRLPDVNHYPVQAVSGLGMKDLVRLATAREEIRRVDSGANSATPKIYYSTHERKTSQLPIRSKEKELCRIVELTIPSKNHPEHPEAESTRQDGERSKTLQHEPQQPRAECQASDENRWSRLSKIPTRDDNDDALTVAIGTSRSCQSSVLSQAVSPLSQASLASARKGNHSVREMLTASVRDLQPFRCNGAISGGDWLPAGDCGDTPKEVVSERGVKQVVSLQTFKNLARRPSMRKFLQELYTTESPTSVASRQTACLISGKPLRKISSHDAVKDEDDSCKTSRVGKLANDSQEENICATRLLKRVRQRQMAAEAYETIRRAMAVDEQNRPKLAILSKCDTVVKSQVSLRGAAM